jgi:hypothetical protein
MAGRLSYWEEINLPMIIMDYAHRKTDSSPSFRVENTDLEQICE